MTCPFQSIRFWSYILNPNFFCYQNDIDFHIEAQNLDIFRLTIGSLRYCDVEFVLHPLPSLLSSACAASTRHFPFLVSTN